MAGQSDKHKSSQAGRTPFYGRPPHQKESPLDRTSFEDANWPPSETGSLLAATRRTTTTWPPTSPIQRHNQEKPKEKGYWYQLVEISGATARCMERHRTVVLEMKAVFVACDRQLWWSMHEQWGKLIFNLHTSIHDYMRTWTFNLIIADVNIIGCLVH